MRGDVVEATDKLVSLGTHVRTPAEAQRTGLPLAAPAAKGAPARSDPDPKPSPMPYALALALTLTPTLTLTLTLTP